MDTIYAAIGRLVVRLAWARFGTQIRVGLGTILAAILLGGWLASRSGSDE
ncbi:hypothetical protein HJD18_07105 [Thermoleophilia bacterium SCSIO 60948]|nr:hypothetical protein HJD18_07105 [Thermoleophilia bacterium SCSIO 60948]